MIMRKSAEKRSTSGSADSAMPADDHAPEAARAADDHDDQEGLHVIEVEEQRIDDPEVEGEDAARRCR